MNNFITHTPAPTISPQSFGIAFENLVHNKLLETKKCIIRDKEIVKKYGKNNYGIDHLVYLDNYIIGIQDKWLKTKPSLHMINHFIKCIDNISQIDQCKCVGIYLSNLPITSGSQLAFNFENLKNKNIFINLYDSNMDLLFQKLFHLFYKNEIFKIDSDGDIFMLES